MPSKRNSVALAVTQPTCVAKTRGGKLIIAVVRDMNRQSASSSFSRDFTSSFSFDVDALSAMISTMLQIQELDNRFRNLESIIDANQREFRSSLQDTFTQFMKRFNALKQCSIFSTSSTSSRQDQGNLILFNAPRDVLSH